MQPNIIRYSFFGPIGSGVCATHVWVVVHDQQVLGAALGAGALVGRHEAGDVVVLEQRQPVDGALVEEVLPVGGGEHLDGHGPLVQGAAVDGAVAAPSDQLEGEKKEKRERVRWAWRLFIASET